MLCSTQMLTVLGRDDADGDLGPQSSAAEADAYAVGMRLGAQRVLQRYIGACNIQVGSVCRTSRADMSLSLQGPLAHQGGRLMVPTRRPLAPCACQSGIWLSRSGSSKAIQACNRAVTSCAACVDGAKLRCRRTSRRRSSWAQMMSLWLSAVMLATS